MPKKDKTSEDIAESMLKDLLKNIENYRKKLDQHTNFIEGQLLGGVLGLAKPKGFYPDKLQELLITAKENLAKISQSMTAEKISTKAGAAEIQKLVNRSMEDVENQYKRVLIIPGGDEAETTRRLSDFCSDVKNFVLRIFEDVKDSVNQILKSSSELEAEDKPYKAAAHKGKDHLFKTSLVTSFGDEKKKINAKSDEISEKEQQLVAHFSERAGRRNA